MLLSASGLWKTQFFHKIPFFKQKRLFRFGGKILHFFFVYGILNYMLVYRFQERL